MFQREDLRKPSSVTQRLSVTASLLVSGDNCKCSSQSVSQSASSQYVSMQVHSGPAFPLHTSGRAPTAGSSHGTV